MQVIAVRYQRFESMETCRLATDRVTTRHRAQNPSASDQHSAEHGVYGPFWASQVAKSTQRRAQGAAPAFSAEAERVKTV